MLSDANVSHTLLPFAGLSANSLTLVVYGTSLSLHPLCPYLCRVLFLVVTLNSTGLPELLHTYLMLIHPQQ